MSSRARKKLAKQNDILTELSKNEDEDELISEGSTFSEKKSKSLNQFTLLTLEKEESPSSDAENDFERDDDSQNNLASEVQQENERIAKKKKNRKKKKKKADTAKGTDDDADVPHEDEIDKSLREVNELLGVKAKTNACTTSENVSLELNCKAILGVEHRNLNAEYEMRKRFGANVVGNERRRNVHRRLPARSSWLVTPRQNWKPATKIGISMKLLESKGGYSYFTFEHLPSYQDIQFKFVEAVESLDHNNIVALLNNHPNHIDSLLQLSEVCKMSEDHQMAAELIERALYIFERSFHTLFNVTRANCRLDYRRSENRSFFLALFRHLGYVGDRACYRTSLEFCKLILGLDPEDPLAILLMIDFFALKAEQYDYILQLFNEWELTKNLLKLPNFSFSVPLAMFSSQKHSKERASTMIQDALIKFPTTLPLLMDKCGIVLKDEIVKHPYFQRTNDLKLSAGLNRLIALYVGRNYSLWKVPEVLDWLAECALCAIKRLEKKDPLVKEWEPLWKSMYQKVPLNIYRHIIISDIKEATRGLPPDISGRSVNTYDPLPPEDSVSGYTLPERTRQREADGGFLSLFLRSLLPSYGAEERRPIPRPAQQEPQEQQAQQPQGAAAVLRPGLENDITEGAQRLMGAMRELLTSMTYRGDLEENGDEHGEEFNDEDWQDPEDFE